MNKKTTLDFLWFLISRVARTFLSRDIKRYIRKQLDANVTFSGWGMRTDHELPWNGGIGNKEFLRASQDVKKHFEFSGDDGVNLSYVDELLWRHWIVSYCVRYAIKFTNEDLDIVECGTCDGLTAFFALRELRGLGSRAKMHLYDAWAPMRNKYLLQSEKRLAGCYSNISIQRVKKNLYEFDNVVYHQGYIPESLHLEPPSPEKISFLHIDLNSAMPTVEALKYFFPRLAQRGIILFDDYGCISYDSTKIVVDKFFADKPGILMPLPTCQAIYLL